MADMVELVDLPDASVQPLLHPLDLPDARRPFTFGWLVGVFTGPAVGVALGAVVWWLTDSYLIAVIAAISLVLPGAYAARFLRDQAWEFIPRKRQDRDRVLPPAWEVTEGLVVGGSLALTIVLVALRLGEPDIPPGVQQFVVGSGAVAIALIVCDLLAGVVLHRGRAARRPWLALPIVISVLGAGVIAYGRLAGDDTFAVSDAALLGALSMGLAGIAVVAWPLVARRATDPA